MTSLGTSKFFKKYLNVPNLTICNKNLDCFNNLALLFKDIFQQRNFRNCIIKSLNKFKLSLKYNHQDFLKC